MNINICLFIFIANKGIGPKCHPKKLKNIVYMLDSRIYTSQMFISNTVHRNHCDGITYIHEIKYVFVQRYLARMLAKINVIWV